ncbi:GGDEF domain-containing phosphodiesterase [Sphingosinicella sp. BN140058]|uniref:GGDEF domain-containing phosphodiesterase n=1 Tax=Sphingosinicella sp. BN140058 TaxID=1892855 RepID=UPI0010102CF6|nr:GGDEF domain-containing phosphodiesterase [Sphingosinicella sp. BN140058]QAY79057.1 phosphodiesterase [Sphingosinicella sp. BN140058]
MTFRSQSSDALSIRAERILVFAIAGTLASIAASLDFFERFRAFSARYEHFEVDEVLTALLGFALAGAWLAWRTSRRLSVAMAEVQSLQAQAIAAARLDPLTGLPNRRALAEFVADHRNAGEGGSALTVLISDLNHFKAVNDTHGHRAGDIVLREIGARLRAVQTDHDGVLIVRLGGDEFAAVVHHDPESDLPERISRRIAQAARRPIAIAEDLTVTLSASVGMAGVVAGTAIDETLSAADAAMYAAKRRAASIRATHAPAAADTAHGTWRRRLLERPGPLDGRGRTVFAAALSIDRFAAMRATIGHAMGAQLVRELVERLGASIGELAIERIAPDTVAIAFDGANAADAADVIERLQIAAEGAIAVGDHVVDLSVTIGYAGPGSADELRVLGEQAQIALDQARNARHRRALFSKADYGDPSDRLALMRDMRAGLANGEITLRYQPKIRIRDDAIDGVEALIRWRHPVRGSIGPEEFVRIAEETGDIRDMTEWVLHRVIADQAFLRQSGIRLPVHVNMPARLVGDEAFTRRMLALIGTAEGEIGLEVTEIAVIDDPANALANLHLLADAGIRLSIDDYGAGTSSLAYLKQLPVQELKIDRQFITELVESRRDPLIVRSTIDLAHGLGMDVTAEGVETEAARDMLRVMGCDRIQGFLVAPALEIEELIDFCARRRGEGQGAAEESRSCPVAAEGGNRQAPLPATSCRA